MAAQAGAYKVGLAAVTGGGGAASIANPEGVDLFVTRVILNVTTKSTAACTLDAGIAANGTTSADTLLDGIDVGTAAAVFDNIRDATGNGKAGQKWGSGQYLTISEKTGAIAGLVGDVLIEYVRLG